jgi:hypothetical protein
MTANDKRVIIQKSEKRLPISDKHKTRRQKGAFYLLDGLACDLEPMVPGARHLQRGEKDEFKFTSCDYEQRGK